MQMESFFVYNSMPFVIQKYVYIKKYGGDLRIQPGNCW